MTTPSGNPQIENERSLANESIRILADNVIGQGTGLSDISDSLERGNVLSEQNHFYGMSEDVFAGE